MRKIKSILATVLVMTVVLGTQVFATTFDQTILLPAYATLTAEITKSSNTDKLAYDLKAVYPTGKYDKDTYTRIKLGANKTGTSTVLMSERVIYEGDGVKYWGYNANLNKGEKVSFHLRGNDPKLAAYAHIYLNAY